MNSMLANTAAHARTQLGIINTALTAAGLDPVPGPDLDNLPTVTAPTPEEVTTALLTAKGDPATDKHVQALATRAWLAQHTAPRALEHQAWVDLWDHFTSEQAPSLLATIRDHYREAGAHLATAATGPLRSYTSLGDIDLATLPTPAAHAAADLLPHYRHAVALHAAWRRIIAALGQPQPAHWSEQATPTLEQYMNARDSRPQTFPPCDPWAIARKHWTLELAANLTDAQNRRNTLREQANKIDSDQAATSRRHGLKGGGVPIIL